MASDHGSSWDPNVVGPVDRCLRCWTPIAQDLAYCATCGHATLVFHSLPLEDGEPCSVHNDRAAEWTCCLCERPICRECCALETHPFTTVGPLWHCQHCIDAAKAIEAKYFRTLAERNCCSKHTDLPTAFTCKRCGLPLCLSCAYFTAKGLFKKRVNDGPYCLGCFRMATVGRERGVWFSGHDLAPGLF
jgi:hypothetical protein